MSVAAPVSAPQSPRSASPEAVEADDEREMPLTQAASAAPTTGDASSQCRSGNPAYNASWPRGAQGAASVSSGTTNAQQQPTAATPLTAPANAPRLPIPIRRRSTGLTNFYIAQQEEREGPKINEAFATLMVARKDPPPAAARVMPPPVDSEALLEDVPVSPKSPRADSPKKAVAVGVDGSPGRDREGSASSLAGLPEKATASSNTGPRPSTPSMLPAQAPRVLSTAPSPPPPTTHVRLPPSVRSSPLPRNLPPLRLEDYDIDPVTGFVPSNPTLLARLPAYYEPWEKLVDILTGPKEIIRRIVDEELPVLRTDELRTRREWQRAYVVLAYIVHSYVWGDEGFEARNYLPPQLSLPLVRVSQSLGLRPSLSMYSANHYNWRALDPSLPPSLDNIWTSVAFTDLDDEAWFNLVSISIELKGAEIVQAMVEQVGGSGPSSPEELEKVLWRMAKVTDEMTHLLGRMRERCRPEMFWKGFRRFLAGWEGVNSGRGMFYEGVKFIGKLEGEIDAEDTLSSLEVRGVKQAPVLPRGIGENGIKGPVLPKMTRGVDETRAPVEEGPRTVSKTRSDDMLQVPASESKESASSASSEEDDLGARRKKVMGLTTRGDAFINQELVMGVYGKFGGATAAQSPTIQAMDIFLGVDHRPTGMTSAKAPASNAHGYVSPLSSARHPPLSTDQPHQNLESTTPIPASVTKSKPKNFLLEMRNQMPTSTRLFLRDLTLRCRGQGPAPDGSIPGLIRTFVLAHAETHPKLGEAYNAACDSMKRFRERHMGLAHSYIAVMARQEGRAGGSGSVGTGGSEMMPFLKQSKAETVERMVGGAVPPPKKPGEKAEDEFE